MFGFPCPEDLSRAYAVLLSRSSPYYAGLCSVNAKTMRFVTADQPIFKLLRACLARMDDLVFLCLRLAAAVLVILASSRIGSYIAKVFTCMRLGNRLKHIPGDPSPISTHS